MSSFLNPLLRRTLTQAAGSAAAGKLAQQLSQHASELRTQGPTDEDRTRFLLWLRGDFRKREPDAFDRIWSEIQRRKQWKQSEGAFGEADFQAALTALTAVWLQLHEDRAARDDWFRELGAAAPDEFATLIEAAQPQPSPLQQRAASLLDKARETARDFDPATERGKQRAAQRADKARALGQSLSDSLLGRRKKR